MFGNNGLKVFTFLHSSRILRRPHTTVCPEFPTKEHDKGHFFPCVFTLHTLKTVACPHPMTRQREKLKTHGRALAHGVEQCVRLRLPILPFSHGKGKTPLLSEKSPRLFGKSRLIFRDSPQLFISARRTSRRYFSSTDKKRPSVDEIAHFGKSKS